MKYPGRKAGTAFTVRYLQEDVDRWLAEISAEAVQREAHRNPNAPSPRARKVPSDYQPKRKRLRAG